MGGCSSGTETGNPSLQGELSYTAYSSAPLLVGVREGGSEGVVHSAWLDLDAVVLFSGNCADAAPEQFSIPALGIGDHASGKHNATSFELGANSSYCALELPFVQAPPSAITADEPAELARHSIMIAGALADGTPFTILSASMPFVRLSADAGSFEIGPKQAQTLITFDVATWLTGLAWDAATRTASGITISETENAALLAQFASNLARGVALYRDSDGDGKLDVNALRLAHAE